MPETAHLVRAHTLCPLCNIACAPICAQMTAKSHVCGGENVRPMKGQDILAERNFALNAISRSPFSDENAIRKTYRLRNVLSTAQAEQFVFDMRMFRHRRSMPVGSTGGTEAIASPFDRMQGFSAGTHYARSRRLQWQPAGHPMP